MSKFNQYLEAVKKPMRNPMGSRPSEQSMRVKFEAQFPGESKEYIDDMWKRINHAMCKSNSEINDGYPHGIKRWLKSKGIK